MIRYILPVLICLSINSWANGIPNSRDIRLGKNIDLNYSNMGIYGSNFNFCDLNLRKIRYYGKRKNNQALSSQTLLKKNKINLPEIYPLGKDYRIASVDYIRNVDVIFSHLDPEELYGVILGEEHANTGKGRYQEVLNNIYDHIKQKYLTRVFQWLSPPCLGPEPGLKADGWVIDPYRSGYAEYRRKVMRHLVTGKPLIACIWGSPAMRRSANLNNEEILMRNAREQLKVCREFNVPVFFFAVDWDRRGSSLSWLSNQSNAFVKKWRKWVFDSMREARKLDISELPEKSANYSIAPAILFAGNKNHDYTYIDDFSDYRVVDDASIAGFLNIMWSEQKKELVISRSINKNSLEQVELLYHFQSKLAISNFVSSLSGKLFGDAEVAIALSDNKDKFSHFYTRNSQNEKVKLFSLKTQDLLPKGQDCYVKVICKTSGKKSSIHLNRFVVTAKTRPLKIRRIELKQDENGRINDEINFSSQSYLHFSENIRHEEMLIWVNRPGWRPQPGYVGLSSQLHQKAEAEIRFKIIIPSGLSNLEFTAQGLTKSKKASNKISLVSNGKLLTSDSTVGKKSNKSGKCSELLKLKLNKMQLQKLKSVTLIVNMTTDLTGSRRCTNLMQYIKITGN